MNNNVILLGHRGSILARSIVCSLADFPSDSCPEPPQRLVHALHDYDARNEKELSFKRGDVIEVFALTPDNNWWDGFIDEKRGYIPASYVKVSYFLQANTFLRCQQSQAS